MSQRMDALERGNRIRLARAQKRREVRTLLAHEGREEVAVLLLIRPEYISTLPVAELLGWPRRTNSRTVLTVLKREFIPENKWVGELTDRQARVLADWIVG